MAEKENQRIHNARKVLRSSRESRRKILFGVYLLLAAVLLTAAVLYVFVWRQPKQPDIPEDMIIAQTATSAPAPSPVPTAQPTPIATTEPDATPKPLVMQESFKELYEQNSDIVGWISVDNTDINYPIVQSIDNDFYMDKGFDKEYSYPGSIFLDFRSDIGDMFDPAHNIIYGHNMKNGTMFQQLTKYQDETFFDKNRYITINTLYGNYVFEVFAAYETPVSFYYLETNFANDQMWLDFITVFQEKSAFETDIVLDGSDIVITLSTCPNSHRDDMRFVVHARLIDP